MLGVGGDQPYGGKAAGGEKREVVRQQEEAVSLPVEDQAFGGGLGPREGVHSPEPKRFRLEPSGHQALAMGQHVCAQRRNSQ